MPANAANGKYRLSGRQLKFCQLIVTGESATDAYALAYEGCSREAARRNGHRLLTKADIGSEIARLRRKAEEKAGSAFLSYIEKRTFLARILRCRPQLEPADSDLWQSVEIRDGMTKLRLPDKLAAIDADNDLAGQGSEANAHDQLSEMLRRCIT
jgi:phage terminase small subunit